MSNLTATTPATEQPTETATPTLTLPYLTALRGIGAVLPYASADKVTPVIMSVQVTGTHFIATDRYTIGAYQHTASDIAAADELEPFTIPSSAAAWLIKQTARALNRDANHVHQLAQVTLTPTAISITVDDATLAMHVFDRLGGNYPPVLRLLEGWEPAIDATEGGVWLNADFLARYSKSAKALTLGERFADPVIRVELGKQSGGKPSPVRITIGEQFASLLQPNLPTLR